MKYLFEGTLVIVWQALDRYYAPRIMLPPFASEAQICSRRSCICLHLLTWQFVREVKGWVTCTWTKSKKNMDPWYTPMTRFEHSLRGSTYTLQITTKSILATLLAYWMINYVWLDVHLLIFHQETFMSFCLWV